MADAPESIEHTVGEDSKLHLTAQGREEIERRATATAKAEGCTCDPVVTVSAGEGDSGTGTFSTVIACGLSGPCTRETPEAA